MNIRLNYLVNFIFKNYILESGERMNILFISMFPLENNYSATIQNIGIIKGFYELGHQVDIMTMKPMRNSMSFDESINTISNLIRTTYYINPDSKYSALMAKKKDMKFGKDDASTGSVFNKLKKKGRDTIKVIYNNVAIFDAQKTNVKHALKLNVNYDNYDIIISSSDPKSSHLVAKKIYETNSKIKAKWIQYWGDPMYNDITRKKDWRNTLVKYNEKELIKKADKIIYASPLTLKVQKETYPNQSNKMDYASQVFINDTFENVHNYKSNKTNITLGYFGAYNTKVRNIIPLYKAALDSDYILNICGPSDLKLSSTERIKVYGMIPYNEVIKMEQSMDILVTICNNSGTQIPGKIYYCSGYNKPIIIILDGEYKEELRAYFETFNRYIICENHSDSIIKAVEEAKNKLQCNGGKFNQQLTPKYMGAKILSGLKMTLEEIRK